ncbi:hypothetical protein ACH5RR_039836 [Cinchona calisaya]|uniref:Peptidase S8/S53 domain-containing protein n=1 Tax=Cinchona calisaya TaxID=153742 RepID=A0ABD2XZT8_9GENT
MSMEKNKESKGRVRKLAEKKAYNELVKDILLMKRNATACISKANTFWEPSAQDITAPGVDILATWSPIMPPSFYVGDKRNLTYDIISVTSMATHHASAATAYVQVAHPD